MNTTSVVEFKVHFVSREIPRDDRVAALCDWCARFAESGLTPRLGKTGRSLGNLSFRLAPGSPAFVITGSALPSKGKLTAAHFVTVLDCDPGQGVVFASGTRDPSSESVMHHAIYKQRADVGAIFHGHDAEITAGASRLCVPETATAQAPRSLGLAREVLKILKQENFLVMKGHGFLSLGGNMEEAGLLALQMKKVSGYRA